MNVVSFLERHPSLKNEPMLVHAMDVGQYEFFTTLAIDKTQVDKQKIREVLNNFNFHKKKDWSHNMIVEQLLKELEVEK